MVPQGYAPVTSSFGRGKDNEASDGTALTFLVEPTSETEVLLTLVPRGLFQRVPKTIVIHNHKGGVGKTTTAICLATALAGMTRSVVVWDADPQGSATEWAELAAGADDPLPFDVEIVNQVRLKRAPSNGADYVIIDTPPGDPRIADTAVRLADFVILPTSPATIDLTRMLETADQIPSQIPRAALITRANKQTVAYKTATEFLYNHPRVPVFTHAIGDRQAIQNSYGTRPEMFYDYSAVTDELVAAMEVTHE